MEIIEIRELEDCFDGSFMKEALMSQNVTKEFIFHLGREGELDYFPTFLRPFYRVHVPGKYMLKGIEGNNTIRIILNRDNIEFAQKQFIELVSCFTKQKGEQNGVKAEGLLR